MAHQLGERARRLFRRSRDLSTSARVSRRTQRYCRRPPMSLNLRRRKIYRRSIRSWLVKQALPRRPGSRQRRCPGQRSIIGSDCPLLGLLVDFRGIRGGVSRLHFNSSGPRELQLDRKLAAILAADVVGYSAMMERDEAVTHERLRSGRKDLFQPTVSRHHGVIFKLMGDGLLAEFTSVVDAINAPSRYSAALSNAMKACRRISRSGYASA